MPGLLDDWIGLFNEKDFKDLKNEPLEMRNITMLYVAIQKEFKRVEDSIKSRLELFRSTLKPQMKDSCKPQHITHSPIKEYSKQSPTKHDNDNMIAKSPVFERRRKSTLKKFKKPICQLNTLTVEPLKTSRLINTQTPKRKLEPITSLTNIVEDEDIFESSIIEVTPNIRQVKKPKCKMPAPKKLNSKNTTLTQMFNDMETREDTKNGSSMMEITEILNKVDELSTPEANISKVAHCIDKKFVIHKKSDFCNSYDKVPEQPKSPKKTYIYKETVRGNERKKLRGWSCKNCEQFYKGLNLPEEELEEKMNECSKHKSRFQPEEETIPGFWDLSIPDTPESDKTQYPNSSSQEIPGFVDLSIIPDSQEDEKMQASNLSQESLGNNSTIFAFYKT